MNSTTEEKIKLVNALKIIYENTSLRNISVDFEDEEYLEHLNTFESIEELEAEAERLTNIKFLEGCYEL